MHFSKLLTYKAAKNNFFRLWRNVHWIQTPELKVDEVIVRVREVDSAFQWQVVHRFNSLDLLGVFCFLIVGVDCDSERRLFQQLVNLAGVGLQVVMERLVSGGTAPDLDNISQRQRSTGDLLQITFRNIFENPVRLLTDARQFHVQLEDLDNGLDLRASEFHIFLSKTQQKSS